MLLSVEVSVDVLVSVLVLAAEKIGAAINDANGNEIKDNIKGSQCWCPITNLDTADACL